MDKENIAKKPFIDRILPIILIVAAVIIIPIAFFEFALVTVLGGACVTLSSSAANTYPYELNNDIETITSARIVDFSNETGSIGQDLPKTLGELEADEARAIAQKLCTLEYKRPLPPQSSIHGTAILFFYSDGGCEYVGRRVTEYHGKDYNEIDSREIDEDDFTALITEALGG